ncbi:hypothetical protein [Spartinivicinus poritis]|uniref:Uncharacterized protein n=1 Tax=Spartinivicinus poritis TaxID=2994640 RepID=A0ABT5UGI3_9GAMM|nr:hypothetical protein [Spartinivicinus sp. A2-2]MDE1465486.1 hypothetical protein [Spartinivicinus sp. A2-2]
MKPNSKVINLYLYAAFLICLSFNQASASRNPIYNVYLINNTDYDIRVQTEDNHSTMVPPGNDSGESYTSPCDFSQIYNAKHIYQLPQEDRAIRTRFGISDQGETPYIEVLTNPLQTKFKVIKRPSTFDSITEDVTDWIDISAQEKLNAGLINSVWLAKKHDVNAKGYNKVYARVAMLPMSPGAGYRLFVALVQEKNDLDSFYGYANGVGSNYFGRWIREVRLINNTDYDLIVKKVKETPERYDVLKTWLKSKNSNQLHPCNLYKGDKLESFATDNENIYKYEIGFISEPTPKTGAISTIDVFVDLKDDRYKLGKTEYTYLEGALSNTISTPVTSWLGSSYRQQQLYSHWTPKHHQFGKQQISTHLAVLSDVMYIILSQQHLETDDSELAPLDNKQEVVFKGVRIYNKGGGIVHETPQSWIARGAMEYVYDETRADKRVKEARYFTENNGIDSISTSALRKWNFRYNPKGVLERAIYTVSSINTMYLDLYYEDPHQRSGLDQKDLDKRYYPTRVIRFECSDSECRNRPRIPYNQLPELSSASAQQNGSYGVKLNKPEGYPNLLSWYTLSYNYGDDKYGYVNAPRQKRITKYDFYQNWLAGDMSQSHAIASGYIQFVYDANKLLKVKKTFSKNATVSTGYPQTQQDNFIFKKHQGYNFLNEINVDWWVNDADTIKKTSLVQVKPIYIPSPSSLSTSDFRVRAIHPVSNIMSIHDKWLTEREGSLTTISDNSGTEGSDDEGDSLSEQFINIIKEIVN